MRILQLWRPDMTQQDKNVIHDLNNLIAAMRGYSGLLVEDLCEGTKQRKYAQYIQEAGDAAQELVNCLRYDNKN